MPDVTAVTPRQLRPSSHGDPVARVAFYRRNEARPLPVDYFQPGLPRVTGMLLLSLLTDRADLPARALRTWFYDYLLGVDKGPFGAHHRRNRVQSGGAGSSGGWRRGAPAGTMGAVSRRGEPA